MYCRNCGNEVSVQDKFCPHCGTQVNTEPSESKFDHFIKKTFMGNGAISYEKAGNIYSSIIVLIQLITIALGLILGESYGLSYVNLLFLLLDWYFLSKQGIRGFWKAWGLFVIPVYMWLRARKTNRKYKWATLSTIICVVGIAVVVLEIVAVLYQGTDNNASQVDKIAVEEASVPDTTDTVDTVNADVKLYECEIDGYVAVQQGAVGDIVLSDYLPANAGDYYYSQRTDSTHEKAAITHSIYSYVDGKIIFNNELVDSDYAYVASTGSGYFQEATDRITKIYEEIVLGNYSEDVILIPIGETFSNSTSEIYALPDLFTVTVEAGKFTDCICIQETESDNDETYITASFYAPDIGLVLEESKDSYTQNIFQTDGYAVTEELTEYVLWSNSGDITGDAISNTIQLSNGLKITMPDSWDGNYEAFEGTIYYAFYEKENYENGDWENGLTGRLFQVMLVWEEDEIDLYYPDHMVLGYFINDGSPYGVVVCYPSEPEYDTSNDELAEAYLALYDTIDELQFDTSEMEEFIPADEETLRAVLSAD